MNPKCGQCSFPGPCVYQAFPFCPVPTASRRGKEKLLATALRMSIGPIPGNAPTFEQMLQIEQCVVRQSDCNCLGKEAVCRRGPEPVSVLCLTVGPNGSPCPGVQHIDP